jgi:Na+/proline symporter
MEAAAVALPTLDLAIILVYLVGVVALGVFLHRAGTRGINAYFLGENQTRWWVLAAVLAMLAIEWFVRRREGLL